MLSVTLQGDLHKKCKTITIEEPIMQHQTGVIKAIGQGEVGLLTIQEILLSRSCILSSFPIIHKVDNIDI